MALVVIALSKFNPSYIKIPSQPDQNFGILQIVDGVLIGNRHLHYCTNIVNNVGIFNDSVAMNNIFRGTYWDEQCFL
jgi:hypothetical protein